MPNNDRARHGVPPQFILILLCLTLFARGAWALRIVSLLPSNTETLEALGAGDEIVGVTIFETLKPGRVVVGDFVHPNLEQIVALKPDLIVAGQWKSSRAVPRLRAMGYRLMEVPNPSTLDDMYAGIRQIAEAAGRAAEAERVISDLKRRVGRLQAQAKSRPGPLTTYIEIDQGLWTPGGPDFLTEAFTLVGLENIFRDVPQQAAQVSAESILKRNPQVILCISQSCQQIEKRPGWSSVSAIRRGRIIRDINPDLLTRPSPRLLDGLELLSDQLQSGAFR